MKRWCQPLGLHARSFTNSFVCNFLSSSAGFILCSCFFRLTLAFWLSLSGFSGPSIPRPCAVSFPLSDLRCFGFLSSASVLDSDYSASVLPFPFFLPPPRSGFLSAPFPLSLPRSSPFSPAWFPVRSFPVPVLSFAVRFLSLFPDSLPQPFLRCSLSRFPLPFRFLSSASLPIPATQPSVSSFP